MKGSFKFLGTSGSVGVPVIGCNCLVCQSTSYFNKRLRPCSLIKVGDKQILIDAGPDFYHQAHKYSIKKLDGVIFTHAHYDHIAGLDDLRVFSFFSKQPLPLLVSRDTKEEISRFFSYLFEKDVKQKFIFEILESSQKQSFLNIPFKYCFYHQIGMKVTGYRFGDLSYITDIKIFDDSLFELIEGSKTLIISSLEWNPTRAHLGLYEVEAIAKKAKVERCIVTHIGHELDHKKTNEKLPDFMELAYDGMSVDFEMFPSEDVR